MPSYLEGIFASDFRKEVEVILAVNNEPVFFLLFFKTAPVSNTPIVEFENLQ